MRVLRFAILTLAFTALCSHAATLVGFKSTWNYLKGTTEASSPVGSWRLVGFLDGAWPGGAAPFGYGTAQVGTTLADMQNGYTSVFMRQAFNVGDAAGTPGLTLHVNYDDAFIVWINGTEVARSTNAPAAPTFNGIAAGPHAAGAAETFTFSASALVNGKNIIAVQAFNSAIDSPEFFIDLELDADGEEVEDTSFSTKRGFYEAPFDLAIITPTPDATIRYTLDGTNPTSTTGTIYTGPIPITRTICVKAMAYKSGMFSTNIDTHTYIFVADVPSQSPNGVAPPGWPANWSPNRTDYGMDPLIVNNATWSADILAGLKSLPALSLVLNTAEVFGPGGNYSNADNTEGMQWERPLSIERIDPNGDTKKQFQAYAGMRIRGGSSDSTNNPKHSMKIIFRSEYGMGKLDFKLFGEYGADSINSVDLQVPQVFSWHYGNYADGVIVSDIFSRDCERDMGIPTTRGDWHNVFINGQYWGIFCTEEKQDGSYGESYFGGKKDNYDHIKVSPNLGYQIHAVDGTFDSWQRLWNQCNAGLSTNAAFMRVQGKNPDGTRNPAYENLLEVEQLIDYMLVVYYVGQRDAPISAYLSNNGPNNWMGLYDRTGKSGGYRFILHDNEASLLCPGVQNVNEDRVGPPNTFYVCGDNIAVSSPQWVFRKCADNAEFRLQAADRINKFFFNNGELTPAQSIARWNARVNEVFLAVTCESARWGNAQRNPAYTRNDWMNQVNNHLNNFFPVRTNIVFNQLRARGLWPNINPPTFSQLGGDIPPDFKLTISNPQASGNIYYTIDGTDPRLLGGAISPAAFDGGTTSTIATLPATCTVKARIFNAGTWSALTSFTFNTSQDYSKLLITEIMYNPEDAEDEGSEYEFIEIKNTGNEPLNLTDCGLTTGVHYLFPAHTIINPGEFKVVVGNAENFALKYPSVPIAGQFVGNLSNSGERIIFSAPSGPIFSVEYGDSSPWPELADGQEFSVVPMNPNLNPDPDDAVNWRASALAGGSPGTDDLGISSVPVYINEIMPVSAAPDEAFIELVNLSNDPVDIGGWYISNNASKPKKFRIPIGSMIGANNHRTYYASDFNPTPGVDPSFALTPKGGTVYLFSTDVNGVLTGFSDLAEYGESDPGISFGRYVTSENKIHFPVQRIPTPNTENSGPQLGPVVVNEIMYNPPLGSDEYIELKNVTFDPIQLYDPLRPANTWKLTGVGYDFPQGVVMPVYGAIIVCSIDPVEFRAKYSIDPAIEIFGPYPGILNNAGELVELKRPGIPTTDNDGLPFTPYITVDAVRFNNKLPWPLEADGSGCSLERTAGLVYGNDPINWRASDVGGSPGIVALPPFASFSAPSFNAKEENPTADLTVSLNVAPELPVSVIFATENGTANSSDYEHTIGSVTIPAGETSKTISIPLVNDQLDEFDKVFSVRLSGPTNGLLGSLISASVTVTDDDSPPTLALQDMLVEETAGTITVVIRLSGPSDKVITVNYATQNGSAFANSDYRSANGKLTYNPGVTQQSFTIDIINDIVIEPDRTFAVAFSQPTNLTLPVPPSMNITIHSEDVPPSYDVSGLVQTNLGPLANVAISNGIRTVTTDATGQFKFTNVLNGTYTLTPMLAGFTFAPPTRTINVAGLPITDLLFTAENSPPQTSGGIVATPNPGFTNEPVTFSFVAFDEQQLTWDWTFGDGATEQTLVGQVSHTYTQKGNYSVSVTVSDPYGATATWSDVIAINNRVPPPLDSDNDTYTNPQEQGLGTNPFDPSSKPGGTADFDHDGLKDDVDDDDDDDFVPDLTETAQGTNPYNAASANKKPLVVTKLAGSVKPGTGKDAFSATGTVANVPAISNVAGQTVIVRVGGAPLTFTLDAKGKAKSQFGTLALLFKPATKIPGGLSFPGGTVTFSIKAKGTFKQYWIDEGVDITYTSTNPNMVMVVDMKLAGEIYSGSKHCVYSSKAGKSATFK